MTEIKVSLSRPEALDSRGAALLAQFCSRFQSNITIIKDEYAVDGKSVLGIITVPWHEGEEYLFKIEGKDEETAAQEIKSFFMENF